MDAKPQPRQIPMNPGVYFFKNAKGTILYIGKAKNLRARLSTYFRDSSASLGHSVSKLTALVKESYKVEWEIVNSEIEALIKEAELIKKFRPKYNVLMRDDKNYLYVAFSKEKFPRIFLTHQPNSGADYIGPFTEVTPIKTTLKMLRRNFPYCTCKNPHKRICLNTRLGKCPGFCCVLGDTIVDANYKKNISAIKKILSGKNRWLMRELKQEMKQLSKEQKYENAGIARNQIRSLERIFEHRGVIKRDIISENQKALNSLGQLLKIKNLNRIEAYDIANIQGEFAYGSMSVFADGSINKDEYRIFRIREVSGSNDPAMISEVIVRRFNHPEWSFPQAIIVDGGKPQLNAAYNAVRQISKLKIIALTKNKKHVGDHIFLSGQTNPMPLEKLPSPLKNLILQLDSEAHRFAISHYRRLHGKRILT